MYFLIDARLPPALARWLTSKEFPADHVVDHNMIGSDDSAIWNLAVVQHLIIVSKDDDFATRRTMADTGPQVVWVRFGNASRNETIARFERALPDIIDALNNGEPLIEIA